MKASIKDTRNPGHQAPTHKLESGVSPESVTRSVCISRRKPPTTYPRAGPITNQVWKIAIYSGEDFKDTFSSRNVVPSVTRADAPKSKY